jgi:nucleotide-binding universal stress UspA family protein
MSTRPVVVGVDGSGGAQRAVRFAAAEAAARRVPLRVITAFAWVPDSVREPARRRHYRSLVLRRAWRTAADAAATASAVSAGIEVSHQVVVGSPVEILVDESRRAQLAVVGHRGLSRAGELVAGSVGMGLAVHADCPVVVVPDTDLEPVGTALPPVVVGVDAGQDAQHVLGFAFAAAAARSVPLVAVHAWTAAFPGTDPGPDATYAGAAAVLAGQLAGWPARYPDVMVRRIVERDRPAAALRRAAHRAQLLVVGTRGHGQVAGMVLGSVAHALVHAAPCPVAVVRRGGGCGDEAPVAARTGIDADPRAGARGDMAPDPATVVTGGA